MKWKEPGATAHLASRADSQIKVVAGSHAAIGISMLLREYAAYIWIEAMALSEEEALSEFECWNAIMDFKDGTGVQTLSFSRYAANGPKFMIMSQVRYRTQN